jgi:hypothetical protein
METYDAFIEESKNSVALILKLPSSGLSILLSDDDPNKVKDVFNALIRHLKTKEYKFKFKKTKEDLFYHIGEEYIKQLNSELATVRRELEEYEMLEEEPKKK